MLLNLCICIYPLLWKREDKRSISVGGSVSTTFSQTEGRMNSMAAVFFLFFFIDVIFNCLQQRTGELNSKYIFYHVTRQKIRAARGNCKVKRSRWTTLKKNKRFSRKQAYNPTSLWSSETEKLRNCSSRLLCAADWGGTHTTLRTVYNPPWFQCPRRAD